MTKAKQRLLDAAKNAGYEILSRDGCTDIVRRRNGRLYRGLRLFEDGTAFDMTVHLSIAKGMRAYRDMYSVLNLEGR